MQRLLSKKCKKKQHMLTDYCCLTTNPPPFQEEKKSTKLKDCQIFIIIKVLEYSNIGVH